MSWTDILNLAYGAGGAAAVASVWHTITSRKKDDRHANERIERDKAIGDAIATALEPNNAWTKEASDRLARIEQDQFGKNHGGIREAVDKINSKVDNLGLEVAGIKGALTAKGVL